MLGPSPGLQGGCTTVGPSSPSALSASLCLSAFYIIRTAAISVGIVCAGPLVLNTAISNWFIRRRGKAIAVSLMGVSLGGVVLSPVGTYLIGAFGWRVSWVVLGIAAWVLVIPTAALTMKRRPEDVGLLPDGDGGSRVLRVPSGRGSRVSSGSSIPRPLPPAPCPLR